MAGKTAKGQAAGRSLIEAAIDGMRLSGLAGAGINEIARTSGAPKGSIYHLFPGGKTQIACEALQLYSEAVLAFLDEALPARGSPKARLVALFEAYANRLEHGECRRSCAAGAVCTDLDDELEPIRAKVAGVFARWIDHLAGRFDFIDDRRRARSFARFVLSSIEGAYLLGRAERSGAPFREAGRWLGDLAAASFAPAPELAHRRPGAGGPRRRQPVRGA
jgi:AcrR family transcriptional regulator